MSALDNGQKENIDLEGIIPPHLTVRVKGSTAIQMDVFA